MPSERQAYNNQSIKRPSRFVIVPLLRRLSSVALSSLAVACLSIALTIDIKRRRCRPAQRLIRTLQVQGSYRSPPYYSTPEVEEYDSCDDKRAQSDDKADPKSERACDARLDTPTAAGVPRLNVPADLEKLGLRYGGAVFGGIIGSG